MLRKLPPEGKHVNIPLHVEREGLTERRKSLYFLAPAAKTAPEEQHILYYVARGAKTNAGRATNVNISLHVWLKGIAWGVKRVRFHCLFIAFPGRRYVFEQSAAQVDTSTA